MDRMNNKDYQMRDKTALEIKNARMFGRQDGICDIGLLVIIMEQSEINKERYGGTEGTWEVNKIDESESISRDSGFDFESDECMNKLEFGKEENMKGCTKYDNGLCYDGGSLAKWRVNKLRTEDQRNGNSPSVRNSLHWEEFFGKHFVFLCSSILASQHVYVVSL